MTTIGGQSVQSVKDIEFNSNYLVYAEYGVGKTVLGGSADAVEELSPVLFLDIEGGTLSLKATYPNVDVIRITDPKQIEAIHKDLKSDQHGYKTVVFDSLTEYQKLLLRFIKIETLENDRKGNREEDTYGQDEYLKSMEIIFRNVRRFRDLPVTTIFTALCDVDYNEKRKKTERKISLTNKLSKQIGGFFDVVSYMYIKEVGEEQKRLLLTQKMDDVEAKDRTQALPNIIENPDMNTIYGYMKKAGIV